MKKAIIDYAFQKEALWNKTLEEIYKNRSEALLEFSLRHKNICTARAGI